MCRHTPIPIEAITPTDGPTLAPIVEVVGHRCADCGATSVAYEEIWRVFYAIASPQGSGTVPEREDFDTKAEALARVDELIGQVGEVVAYPVMVEKVPQACENGTERPSGVEVGPSSTLVIRGPQNGREDVA